MQIPSMQRQVHASSVPIEKLATNPNVSQEEKVGEVSRQFEAILLRQILSGAQKNMFGTSATAAIYQDLMTSQLADNVSHAGGIGLAEHLHKELGRQLAPHHKETSQPAAQPKKAVAANPFEHLHKH